ncbi:hypothetical protein PI125_g7749 [Phytophthora idaei]|nr:hypothetical protein PI125_g7749 [Phytophthora idaei]
MQTLQAPELVRDYHRYMGGVDVHDQLRMQRYSVQLSYKTRKYYETLFLCLVDMALVNAFIVFRHNKKVHGERPPKHYAFFETLMEQLMVVDAETFESIEVSVMLLDQHKLNHGLLGSNITTGYVDYGNFREQLAWKTVRQRRPHAARPADRMVSARMRRLMKVIRLLKIRTLQTLCKARRNVSGRARYVYC